MPYDVSIDVLCFYFKCIASVVAHPCAIDVVVIKRGVRKVYSPKYESKCVEHHANFEFRGLTYIIVVSDVVSI